MERIIFAIEFNNVFFTFRQGGRIWFVASEIRQWQVFGFLGGTCTNGLAVLEAMCVRSMIFNGMCSGSCGTCGTHAGGRSGGYPTHVC
jgi:hypothetical protein